jgi:protein-L-isoaspartate(D-aspartate) O-methyltransferase
LLATLVGETGKVVSIDIDPTITERAKQKLLDFHWVTCITGDGREGFAESLPFNRIVAWTTADYFPPEWRKQLAETGTVVAPFQVLSLANTTVITRFYKKDGFLTGDVVMPGGYIPMNNTPDYDTFGPEMKADARDDEHGLWASSEELKVSSESQKKAFLSMLGKLDVEPSLFQEEENPYDFRAFWLSTQDKGHLTAYRKDTDQLIGFADQQEVALISLYENISLFSSSRMKTKMEQAIEEWRKLGRPAYTALHPVLLSNDVRVARKQ